MKLCVDCGASKSPSEPDYIWRSARCRGCYLVVRRQKAAHVSDATNAQRRKHYADDPEYRRKKNEASRRTYYDNHKRWSEYHRQRHANMTEAEKRERNERMRAYYQANKDRARENRRRWYEQNLERFAENRARWKAENPERYRESLVAGKARRRAREAAIPVIGKVSRRRIVERDGSRCHFCGKRVPDAEIHLDHLIPVSWTAESEHSARNIAVACKSCNLKSGPGRLPAQLRLVG